MTVNRQIQCKQMRLSTCFTESQIKKIIRVDFQLKQLDAYRRLGLILLVFVRSFW